jgi:hypothetical protein
MIFQTDQEPISKPRRKLNWIDAILPTLFGLGGCVLLTYVLGRFLAEYVLTLVFNPGSAEYAAPVLLAAFLLFILAMASALSWKASGRETETSFYLPPVVLVSSLLFLTAYLHKPVPRQPTPGEISAQELRKFKQKLSDPDFVINLKGPLPMERTLALISEIDHADDWFSDLKPEELHALLLNVGAEVEPSIARCKKTWPDDLDWIAHHGGVAARQGAAINPHTPEADVERLLTDPDPGVRYFAERGTAQRVCNPRLLESIWYQDKKTPHGDSDIPNSLAKNPCTPGLILGFLRGDPNPAVRKAASFTLESRSR